MLDVGQRACVVDQQHRRHGLLAMLVAAQRDRLRQHTRRLERPPEQPERHAPVVEDRPGSRRVRPPERGHPIRGLRERHAGVLEPSGRPVGAGQRDVHVHVEQGGD